MDDKYYRDIMETKNVDELQELVSSRGTRYPPEDPVVKGEEALVLVKKLLALLVKERSE